MEYVVEVVLAVSFDEELGTVESSVTTEVSFLGQVRVIIVSDTAFEELHANDSIYIVQ